MRIAFVVHAFPPEARTGVENYSESLARALGERGHRVEVLAFRKESERAYLSQEREERDAFSVTWLTLDPRANDESRRRCAPGAAAALERFVEREQPDVVHFQHLYGFGPEALDRVRALDRPVLFTAHDYFAVSDEYTLLAPDLSPLDPLDFEAAARCRLARGDLDQALAAHDGFLVPDRSPAELVAKVARTLAGFGDRESSVAELARQLRAAVHARLEALARIDHVEAPTRHLADVLVRAGFVGEVHQRDCGIPTDALARVVAPVSRAFEPPLRVQFIGGYYEHKGAHVLLEACAGLADIVHLNLRGCAGSSDYHGVLKSLAEQSGATLGGTFGREDLPGILANADLLALPSLWSENAPFVIREAFAAGVPVIASDTPPLRESLRHGEDALLVRAGDVDAWRAGLRRCAKEKGIMESLRRGIRSPKTIEMDAQELEARYEQLIAEFDQGRQRRLSRLPAHLHEFASRHARLAKLSTPELFSRAAHGLERMQETGTFSAAVLMRIIESGQGLRERLADAERESAWREDMAREEERAKVALSEEAKQLERRADSESARANWLAEQAADRAQGLQACRDELALARETTDSLQAELELARSSEVEWRGRLELSERTQAEVEKRRRAGEQALASLEKERAWLASLLEERGRELDWTRSTLADREAHAAELAGERDDLRKEQAWRREEQERAQRELERVDERLVATQAELQAIRDDRHAAQAHQEFLEASLESLAAQRRQLERDVTWCHAEMRAARRENSGWAQRLLARRLKERFEAWGEALGDSDA